MKIDFEKIARLTGCIFESETDFLYYMQRHITYLATHNKNLTSAQYNKICDLENFLGSITAEE